MNWVGSKPVGRKQNFFYILPLFLLNEPWGGGHGTWWGSDTNLINSLVFHNLKSPCNAGWFSSAEDVSPCQNLPVWQMLWLLLWLFVDTGKFCLFTGKKYLWKKQKKATCGFSILHPQIPKSIPLLKKMNWFSTRIKHLLYKRSDMVLWSKRDWFINSLFSGVFIMPPETFFGVIVLRYAVCLKVNFVPPNGFVINCWIFTST